MSFASWLGLPTKKTSAPRAPEKNRLDKGLRLALERLDDRLVPSTFTVANANDSGAGSLRQAIVEANSNPGADTITFAIGSGQQTIAPASALPTITDPVTIDGTTQPGYVGTPLIEVSGAAPTMEAWASGIAITAGSSTVRGLAVTYFPQAGIWLQAGGGNVLVGNHIGVNPAETAAAGNRGAGITVVQGSSNNRIGTDGDGVNDTAERNVISGNAADGIAFWDAGTTGNVVAGNYIGTDRTGAFAVPNGFAGVSFHLGASGNLIGTDADGVGDAAERNVVSGNVGLGVWVADAGTTRGRRGPSSRTTSSGPTRPGSTTGATAGAGWRSTPG